MALILRRWSRTATVLLLCVSLIGLAGGVSAAPRSDISGNTYTSPRYGFTVTWPSDWVSRGEDNNADYDSLQLTDGLAFASFLGVDAFSGEPLLAMLVQLASMRETEGISNFQTLLDAAGNEVVGNEENRSFTASTFTLTTSDGAAIQITQYLEIRTLVAGQAVLIITATVSSNLYASEYPRIAEVIAGVTIPGQAGTGTGTTTTVVPPVYGEPGPVFVSGQWRIAISRVAVNEEFESIGLKPRSGKTWLVVLADVTNWSTNDGEFAARELMVRAGVDGDLTKAATGSSANVGKKLDVEPASEEMLIGMDAGQTERVVLVYLIPGAIENPVLVHDTEALPVNDVLEITFEADALPAKAFPPEVKTGELVSASDGKTLRVQIEGESSAMKVRLFGVEPPASDACYANEAEAMLDDLSGEQVLVEEDAAVADESPVTQYLWLVNADGTRTLINEQLVSDGLVKMGQVPDETRFGTWMEEGSRIAQETPVGLWLECEEAASS